MFVLSRNGGVERGLDLSKEAWKYQSGDDPSWKNADFDDSHWQRLHATRGTLQPIGIWKGIGWFRLQMEVDSSLCNLPLHLQLQHFGASEVFLNGVSLQRNGKVSADAASEEALDPVKLPATIVFPEAGRYLLAVRYSSAYFRNEQASWWKNWLREQMRVPIIVAKADGAECGVNVTMSMVTTDQPQEVLPFLKQLMDNGILLLFLTFGIFSLLLYVYYPFVKVNIAFST